MTSSLITLQILITELNCNYESSPLLELNPTISQIALFAPDMSAPKKPTLIVGYLSDVYDLLLTGSQPDSLYFLCIKDTDDCDTNLSRVRQHIILLSENAKLEVIFNQLLAAFSKMRDWQTALELSVSHSNNLQELLDLSEPILKNHIDIQDASFKLLAYTKNVSIDDEITERLLANGYHPAETVELFKEYRYLEEYEKCDTIIINTSNQLCKYTTYKRIFHKDNQIALFVIMHCNHIDTCAYLTDLFSIFLHYVNISVKNGNSDINYYAVSQRLFEDLISGAIRTKDEAINRSSYANIPFQDRYFICTIMFYDDYNVPINSLVNSIRRVFPGSYPFIYSRRIVILFRRKDREPSQLDACKKYLFSLLQNYAFCAGISNSFGDLYQMPTAFEQAGCAIEYGVHVQLDIDINEDDSLSAFFLFEDSFLTLIVAKSFNSSAHLFQNCFMLDALRTLQKSDKETRNDSLHLLEVYLTCDRRATLAADILHMHRNTVLYHIERIEALLNISLDDPQVRIKLLLGLMVKKTRMIAPY